MESGNKDELELTQPDCTESEITFRLDLTLDFFKKETCWDLIHAASQTIVLSSHEYSNGSSPGLFMSTACLSLSGLYVFTAYDELVNGICCQLGIGGYVATADGNNIRESSFPIGKIESTRCGLELHAA